VLRQEGTRLAGTASQGAARATVSLARGRASLDSGLGYFASPRVEVVRFTRFGFSARPLAIDLDTGAFGAPPATAERLGVRQYEVRFPAPGATLAGTLTIPPGPGPHPGVVYVSGSGPTLREESHWLDGVFVSRGIAVLAYDKRGNGQSGGRYPGDFASAQTIETLAGDAVAAARFLATRNDIDPARVGFYGISQGGWIIPQAAVRARTTVAWAVIESGPTVTQGESDGYATLVASGTSLPEAETQARGLVSGYDPRPWLDRLAIPVLWLYGGQDRNQPPRHSMEIIRALATAHDFTTALYPGAPHSLFGAAGFPDGLWSTVRDWLAAHRLGPSA
jgi:dienelactone hydrolase